MMQDNVDYSSSSSVSQSYLIDPTTININSNHDTVEKIINICPLENDNRQQDNSSSISISTYSTDQPSTNEAIDADSNENVGNKSNDACSIPSQTNSSQFAIGKMKIKNDENENTLGRNAVIEEEVAIEKEVVTSSPPTELISVQANGIRPIEEGSSEMINNPTISSTTTTSSSILEPTLPINEKDKPKISRGHLVSSYRGLCWNKTRQTWLVRIPYKGDRQYVGNFRSELEAAIAYDKRAKELYGDKAVLNFPDDCPPIDIANINDNNNSNNSNHPEGSASIKVNRIIRNNSNCTQTIGSSETDGELDINEKAMAKNSIDDDNSNKINELSDSYTYKSRSQQRSSSLYARKRVREDPLNKHKDDMNANNKFITSKARKRNSERASLDYMSANPQVLMSSTSSPTPENHAFLSLNNNINTNHQKQRNQIFAGDISGTQSNTNNQSRMDITRNSEHNLYGSFMIDHRHQQQYQQQQNILMLIHQQQQQQNSNNNNNLRDLQSLSLAHQRGLNIPMHHHHHHPIMQSFDLRGSLQPIHQMTSSMVLPLTLNMSNAMEMNTRPLDERALGLNQRGSNTVQENHFDIHQTQRLHSGLIQQRHQVQDQGNSTSVGNAAAYINPNDINSIHQQQRMLLQDALRQYHQTQINHTHSQLQEKPTFRDMNSDKR